MAKRYIPRDISWLHFNERVLGQALARDVPLMERIKFLGIFSNNLDEFYRVRYASWKHVGMFYGYDSKKYPEIPSRKTLKEMDSLIWRQEETARAAFASIKRELASHGVYITERIPVFAERYLSEFFSQKINPVLPVSIVSGKQAMPELKDNVLYLLSQAGMQKTDHIYSVTEIPESLPRFVTLPQAANGRTYVMFMEDIVAHFMKEALYPLQAGEVRSYPFRIVRDSELDIDCDVSKGIVEKVSKGLQKRRSGPTVRLTYVSGMPDQALRFILSRLHMGDMDNHAPCRGHLSMRDLMKFPAVEKICGMHYPGIEPLPIAGMDETKPMFDAIADSDFLMHTPYHSYRYVVKFLREAALDPKVTKLKITLYRLAGQSQIITALVNAARSGKQVTAQIELRARFDEDANLHWAETLRNEGVRLTYGVDGLKVHCKLCMAERTEEDGSKRLYGFVSTGNFNEDTACLYTDYVLFTSHRGIMKDVAGVFDFLSHSYRHRTFGHLLVSPHFMRKKLYKLIDGEIKNARKGRTAYIRLRLNSLTDTGLIDKLLQAGQAGVKIELSVRGACSMALGEDGGNIRIISVVDKFLEHQRVYIFAAGGQENVYISSADWMTRNMDYRVEAACPVYDEKLKRQITDNFSLAFSDNTKACLVRGTAGVEYVPHNPDRPIRTHFDTYDYFKDMIRQQDKNKNNCN